MTEHNFTIGHWDGYSFGYGTLENVDKCRYCGMWVDEEDVFPTCESLKAYQEFLASEAHAWVNEYEPDDPEPHKAAEA